jgi:C-terminal processing protease CtpA/Prc
VKILGKILLIVICVSNGGPADGMLKIGDVVVKINEVTVVDMQAEQVDQLLKSLDKVVMTVLRGYVSI